MTSEKNVDIKVRGKDVYGDPFRMNAQVITVADSEICLSIWRPMAENSPVEIKFHDNDSFWMCGQIMKVRRRLDGTQTVKVKL